MRCLLSSTYFGPVEWYQKLRRYDACLIDGDEHFQKQTYRNRCVILTTAGLQTLTVPVEHPEGRQLAHTPMRDIRISDHGNWRHLHWNALASAYGESPFYEFLADDFRPFFERRWTYLLDFNMAITEKICELLQLDANVIAKPADDTQEVAAADFRSVITPKHPLPDPDFTPRPYYQVYGAKFGFQSNLSILDLLFNMGNESVLYL